MASGVAVSAEIKPKVDEMNLRKTCKWFTMCLTPDMKEVVVEHVQGPDGTFCQLQEFLLESKRKDECRWAVYDHKFVLGNNAPKSRLVFIAWSPDCASIKQKMVYASSKSAVLKAVGTAQCMVTWNDNCDCCEDSLDEVCKRFDKS